MPLADNSTIILENIAMNSDIEDGQTEEYINPKHYGKCNTIIWVETTEEERVYEDENGVLVLEPVTVTRECVMVCLDQEKADLMTKFLRDQGFLVLPCETDEMSLPLMRGGRRSWDLGY